MGEALPRRGTLERRTSERSDTLISLSKWLEATRQRLRATAIAIGDAEGCLIAGAGAARQCEELAAWGTLHHREHTDSGPSTATLQVPGERALVTVAELGRASDKALVELARGCQRILSSPPPSSSH